MSVAWIDNAGIMTDIGLTSLDSLSVTTDIDTLLVDNFGIMNDMTTYYSAKTQSYMKKIP